MSQRSRGRNRQVSESPEPIVVEEQGGDNESVIDLTCTVDEEYVDLTSLSQRSQSESSGVNDASFVILGSPVAELPAHRLRSGRGRHSNEDTPQEDTDEDDELPPGPVRVSQRDNSEPAFLVASPDATQQISCPVCLEDFKSIRKNHLKLNSTSCGHVFCQSCIESAVRLHRACPICRKNLTMKNIIVLHL
ncbi:E3 ubiquitin-protein ligase RNF4-like [Dreissena polymorpha]|uniref:RING-type domain-containing protein n=1 Tax=Dreissena polymorpha TaxID=45954 RepID=A0A9D4EX83_DREPO|nr:E3 ubiquitin-protein ligase RNF4-like [Dreissena polymorpha]KAH3788484.1 hypothetical protein DPMN_166628 [Dreissena polymorpha]